MSREIAATHDVYARHLGTAPLIISLPHVGTALPTEVAGALTPCGLNVADTDWYVDQLYEFARDADVSWLQARYSRYVIDLNRPPDDHALYPGALTSALCPVESFEGERLYAGADPDSAEIARRRESYWTPYHAALRGLVQATVASWGFALLLDAHSIRSRVPRLFEGRLPDVNVGTYDGRSCDAAVTAALLRPLGQQQRFSWVLDGRFKGGYITRAYGDPAAAVHAVQLELAQSAYMQESPREDFQAERAAPLQSVLRQIVAAMLAFAPQSMSR